MVKPAICEFIKSHPEGTVSLDLEEAGSVVHVSKVVFHPERYPIRDRYPFNLKVFRQTEAIRFDVPVTLFVGENGTGKSTLLEALARKCGVHIWRNPVAQRLDANPYEERLWRYLSVDWTDGPVPGSFFGSAGFRDFARSLEAWAVTDPGQLDYFGGKSLLSQSHGQSILTYFRSRYRRKGIYFLDEPETALSPKSQIAFLEILSAAGNTGRTQFIIATHSPIILAFPRATLYSFDEAPIRARAYEETEHYRIYKRYLTGSRPNPTGTGSK